MKELARMRHLQLRNSMLPEEIARKSRAIMERLFSLPEFQRAEKILFYVSFGNEVETLEMIGKALENGKAVAVPITSFKEKRLCLSTISSLGDLEKRETGIMEPKAEKVCEVGMDEINLVIVPGIAFDKEGYRIGYGGGFYDRLLRKAPRSTTAVGLCFEQNLEEQLPKQSHDAKMNKIVTEKRIVEVCA